MSTMFLNIEGNASNFDTFLTELKRLKHSFPVIGLAETNVDEPLKDLYTIPEYTSFYQNTLKKTQIFKKTQIKFWSLLTNQIILYRFIKPHAGWLPQLVM